MGERRGSIPWQFEALFSLILIVLFSAVIIAYVMTHSNGESYFAKFYAADLATTAELANAPAGDVMLRYDNLKPALALQFNFDSGKVSVGPSKDVISGGPNFISILRTYGLPKSYPLGSTYLIRPQFIVMNKNKGSFTITNVNADLSSCLILTKRKVEYENAKIFISVSGADLQYQQKVRESFSSIIPKITSTEADANMKVLISIPEGTANSIIVQPTDSDGAAISCYLKGQLNAITANQYDMNSPDTSADALGASIASSLNISVISKGYVQPEQLGTALGASFAAYFKGTALQQTNTQPNSSQSGSQTPPIQSGFVCATKITSLPDPSGNGCGQAGSVATAGNVQLIGDSLTYGYSQVFKTCGQNSVGAFARVGRTSSCMVKYVDQYLACNPNIVVIMAGTNDIAGGASSADSVYTNIISIRNKANPAAKVYIMTIPPFGGSSSYTDAKKQQALLLNKKICDSQMQSTYKYTCIDAYHFFDSNDDFIYDQKSSDGLHPGSYTAFGKFVQSQVGCQ